MKYTSFYRHKPLFLLTITALFFYTLYHVYISQSKVERGLLEKVESLYNTIYIYKDTEAQRHMVFGYRGTHFTESICNPADPGALPVAYTRFMTLGFAYAPEAMRVLSIGMGGGQTSGYLVRSIPRLDITEVELDPDVLRLAKRYFGYTPGDRLKPVLSDGRTFLMHSAMQYDMIMLDAYRGPFVPFHLLTTEFYREVSRHLNPEGVVMQNIAPDTMLFDSAIATLRKVFDQVEFYPVADNVVAVAYNGTKKSDEVLRNNARHFQEQYHLRYPLDAMLARRKFYTPAANILPLTDDFAPVDALKAIESHNRKWK